jgi:class 3 adenylate cyclase
MYILSTEIITAFTSYLCHSDMYVKEHDNVSILYADVVKYAQLTVSLPVSKLVETLNELFGRFDEASQVINQ